MSLYDSILLIGGNGMLAHAIKRALTARSRSFSALDLPEIDITNPGSVADAFARLRPTLVINCAAYTNVDKCEQQPELADAVNGHAVGTIASMCHDYGSTMVHYSTDFVFDGTRREPYTPADVPNPASAYGRSKLLGERLAGNSALIIRTAWLYGPRGACFPRTMVECARAGKPLKVVSDQVGSPTFTYDLAEATLRLVDVTRSGLVHVTNNGSVSWHGFATAVLEEFDEPTRPAAITAADWKAIKPSAAERPAYSVLDMSEYERATGYRMRPWRQALREYRAEVAETGF